MKISFYPMRSTRPVPPEQRGSRSRLTQHLLARRKRLKQRFGLILVAFIGLESLVVATE